MQSLMLASNFDEQRTYSNTKWLMAEKIDGIRCAIYDGICNRHKTKERAFSRSGKRIPNHEIRAILSTLPNGFDGEIVVIGGDFQSATTAAMTENCKPNEFWQYVIFDDFSHPELAKKDRLEIAKNKLILWHNQYPKYRGNVAIIYSEIGNLARAKERCAELIEHGAEGLMLSDPDSSYLHRRCRPTEANLLKMKHFEDDEAIITSITLATYSGYTNIIKEIDEFKEHAQLKPKQMKALMADADFADRVWAYHDKPKLEMGSITCRSANFDKEFSIGTGFNKELRIAMAIEPTSFINKLIKFKYMPCGTKDRPRSPVFLGFRHHDDLLP